MEFEEAVEKLKHGIIQIHFIDRTKKDFLKKLLDTAFPNNCQNFRGESYYYFRRSYNSWGASIVPAGSGTMTLVNINLIKNREAEKPIIGYKLIKPTYLEAVKAIINDQNSTKGWWVEHAEQNLKKFGYHFGNSNGSSSIDDLLKRAGVIDLWFKPIYKEEKPQHPTIVGYTGKSDVAMGEVVYGCARLRVSMLTVLDNMTTTKGGNRKIRSIELDSGVVITMDEIRAMLRAFEADRNDPKYEK